MFWLGCVLDGPGFDFLRGQKICVLFKTSISVLGPTQPPIERVPPVGGGALPREKSRRGVKLTGHHHVVPMLRIRSVVWLFLLHAFLAFIVKKRALLYLTCVSTVYHGCRESSYGRLYIWGSHNGDSPALKMEGEGFSESFGILLPHGVSSQTFVIKVLHLDTLLISVWINIFNLGNWYIRYLH